MALLNIYRPKYSHFVFRYLFYIFVFTCAALPSGRLFGFPLRIVSACLVLGAFLMWLVVGGKFSRGWLLSLVSVMCFLVFYTCLGIINGYDLYSVTGELSAAIGTVLPIFFGCWLYRQGLLSVSQGLFVIYVSVLFNAFIKIVFFLALFFSFWNLNQFLDVHDFIFNLRPLTLIVGKFIRINVPNDFLFPLALAGLLFYSNKFTGRKVLVFIIISALIISYSRYLWAYAAVVLLACVLSNVSMNKKIPLGWWFSIFLVGAVFLGIGAYYSIQILGFVGERYLGVKAIHSDSIRSEMLPYLFSMIASAPFFGHGFGAYAKDYVRFEQNPWLYELQWISWLKDVGLVGLFLTGLSIILVFFKNGIGTSIRRHWLVPITVLLFWLATAVFNCFLLSPMAGAVFLGVWLIFLKHRDLYGNVYQYRL